MKLIFAILFFNLIAHLDACQCQKNETISYVVPSFGIGEPTFDGTYGGTSCGPADCTTTITINGTNGTLYGGKILIVVYDSFKPGDFLTILAGDQVVQNFTSSPSPPYTVLADSSNVISFHFKIQQNVSFTALLTPIPATAPPTTTPSVVTTTPYPGPYPYNPSIQRVDLIVAVDLNKANTFFETSKIFLKSFTNLLSYNNQAPDISYPNTTHPYARLSLMSFDSYGTVALAPGNLPWSLNQSTLVGLLGTFHTYSPTSAKVFTALQLAFNYMESNGFTFRDNTQRVLVYFAGSDCDNNDPAIQNITAKINQYNLKVIVVIMDSSKGFSGVNFPCLVRLTGSESNVVNNYIYKGNGNPDLQNFISTVYQNGNQICNRPSSSPVSTSTTNSILYQIPLSNTNKSNPAVYCNYMNNVQQYAGNAPSQNIQVLFTNLNTVYGSDSITIDIDGTAVASLSGQYGFHPYYCLPLPSGSSTVGVTFKSSGGKVLSGFTSYVTLYPDNTTCAIATTPAPTLAQGFAENLEYRLMPLNKFF